MPKGEHFKKPNPRIHQVSFKLNATELAEMKRIISESGKSLPQFLRDIIFNSEGAETLIDAIEVQSVVGTPVIEEEVVPVVLESVEEKQAEEVIEAPVVKVEEIIEETPVIEEEVVPAVVEAIETKEPEPVIPEVVEEKPIPVVKKERDSLPKHEPRKDNNNQFSLF